jgi:hypothetical protein
MVFDLSEICYILVLKNSYMTRNKYKNTDKLKSAFGQPIHLFSYHWLVNDDATLTKPPIRIEIHLLCKFKSSSVSDVQLFPFAILMLSRLFIYVSILDNRPT